MFVMLRKIISISFCFLFWFTAVCSQTTQQPLNLEECRNLAIQNNKELKIASEEERKAYYQKKEALYNFFPNLSFIGGYLHNQKDMNIFSSSAIPSSIKIPPVNAPGITTPGMTLPVSEELREKIHEAGRLKIKNFWTGGFMLTQPLFMGGKIIANNDLRAYAQELAAVQKDMKLTDVIVEVDNAYWQVVSASNKQKLADSYVKLLQKMESDIKAMEDEGVATKADRLSVSVKLNEAEMTLTLADNGVSLSKMLLCQLCGLEITDQITLTDESLTNLNVVEDSNPVANVDEGLMNRDEIKGLDLSSKISAKKEKIARSEFMPELALTAGYLWSNPNLFDGYEKKFDGMWNVGVTLKVPLNFWTSSAKLNSAKADTRISNFQLDEAKEKITLEINQSAYKLNEANKKLTAARKNTEKADENLRYANAGFEEGVISASDALSAHTAWISAHVDMIDAQIDVKLCRIYLDKAMGRKLINKQ